MKAAPGVCFSPLLVSQLLAKQSASQNFPCMGYSLRAGFPSPADDGSYQSKDGKRYHFSSWCGDKEKMARAAKE